MPVKHSCCPEAGNSLGMEIRIEIGVPPLIIWERNWKEEQKETESVVLYGGLL